MTRRWTTVDDLRAAVGRRWQSGELLAGVVTGESSFPLRIRISRPRADDLSERLSDVRAWVTGLRSLQVGRVECKESRTRLLGENQLPAALVLDSLDDAASLVDGAPEQLAKFRAVVAATSARRPELLSVLAKRPFHAIAAADVWERLLDVVDWLAEHPAPQRYIREVDLPGVHTKMIEENARLLTSLCDVACPHAVVDSDAVAFDRRFGFRIKPRLVRFRVLDQRLRLSPTDSDGDYTLTAVDFGRLQIQAHNVFIVENEVTFLGFPSLPSSICVWGAGSGLEHLTMAPWLAHATVTYWGDLDTHGFAILQQLRAVLPGARSMLMDRATLECCRDRWGVEGLPATRDLPLLSPDEQEAYDLLRDQRLGSNIRLEQELIPQHLVENALRAVGVGGWR